MDIQASIGGFQGRAVTLLSNYDPETGIVAIAVEKTYSPDKLADDMALISNMELKARDWLFDEASFGVAIAEYFNMKAQGLLAISDSLTRFAPDNKIEADTVDERGRNYRIHADVDNGQVAILATLAYVKQMKSADDSLDMLDELTSFYSGLTI